MKCSIHTNRIGEGIKRLPAGFTKVLQTKVFEAVRTLKQANPEATEVCDNELDDDCDGDIDEGYLRPICNLSDRRRGRRMGVFNDPSRSNPLYSGQFGPILALDPDCGPREWPQFRAPDTGEEFPRRNTRTAPVIHRNLPEKDKAIGSTPTLSVA